MSNSFKSEVFDGAISGQHQTCNTSYVVNVIFVLLILNMVFVFMLVCSFAAGLEQVCCLAPALWPGPHMAHMSLASGSTEAIQRQRIATEEGEREEFQEK